LEVQWLASGQRQPSSGLVYLTERCSICQGEVLGWQGLVKLGYYECGVGGFAGSPPKVSASAASHECYELPRKEPATGFGRGPVLLAWAGAGVAGLAEMCYTRL